MVPPLVSLTHNVRLRSYMAFLAAAFSVAIGGAALVGWATLRPALVQWNRHLAPIPLNGALSLVLIGLGLMFLNRRAFRLALLVALPVVLYSAAATSYLVGTRFGITHAFFMVGMSLRHISARISPLTALMLMVGSFALAFAALTRSPAMGPAAGALLMALATAGLVGQLAPLWPIWRGLRSVSFPTSCVFFAIGAASLNYGWMEIRARRFGLAFVTATIFLTVTVVLAAALHTYEQDELTRTTQSVWQGVSDQIREQTHRPLAIARLAERWEVFGVPPRTEAEREARILIRGVPGLKAMIRVAPSSRVRWRVPFRGSRRVVGHFLDAAPARARAILRARTLNRVEMTPLIHLFRGGVGFVVVAPVRRAGRYLGAVAGIFNTSGFFSHLVVNLWQGYHVVVSLHHVPFFTRGGRGDNAALVTGRVRFLGQTLSLAVSPTRRIVNKIEVGLPGIVLMSGFLLALFSAAAVYAMQQAQRHAQSLDRMNAGLESLILARTASLREERERWRVTLMSIGDGVIVTDVAGRVLAMNTEAERLTGYRDEEAHGRALAHILPLYQDVNGAPIEAPVAAALGSGEIQRLKEAVVLKARDGRILQVSDSAAPIRDEDGAVTGAVIVFRDVTQRRVLEEQAMKAKSLEALGVLAGGIAHDFNNILTAIFGNITLAKIYAPAHEVLQGALSDAERASWRARELTLQLLTFAKGGAPVKKPGSIGETVKDLSGFFVKGSSVRCEFTLPDDLWTTEFDPDQMGQVIQNIVLNAKEAMSGAGVLKVRAANMTLKEGEVGHLPAGEYVRIAFEDTGRGIEKQHLERIFDPYFSLKPTGTGLGLAVTYSVVKRHQGLVVAESVVGQGTTLSLYLPRSGSRYAPLAAGRPRAFREIPATGRGRRILLMDDDPDVRATGAHLLRTLGYAVSEARTGEEAIGLFEQALSGARFDGVVLDLTVPGGMGGKECVRVLRERDPGVRVVVATGYCTDPIVAEFRAYGFAAVVQKPYRLDELSDTLAQVLAG